MATLTAGQLAWFDEADERQFDRQRLRDLAMSRSSVALLPPQQRQALRDRIDALWDEEPELRGGKPVTRRHRTRVRRARRLGE